MTDTQEDIDEKFFRTVGYAITEWAVVEGALFDVFYLAISSKERALALTAYHAILSFQTKLTVTTDTLSVRLRYSVGPGTQHNFSSKPHPIFEEWKKLHARLDRLSKKRNRLAHLPAAVIWDHGNYTIALRPNFENPKNVKSFFENDQALDTQKIHDMRYDFLKMQQAIQEFIAKLNSVLKQRPISPA